MNKKVILLMLVAASLLTVPTYANNDETKINISLPSFYSTDTEQGINYKGSDNYTWIWEEYINAPGPIQTADIVFWGPSYGPYHNYTEVTLKLHSLEEHFPSYVDLFSIGQSQQGRELWTVRITNESIHSNKTEFYLVAAHHAREAITVENALYFIDKLIYEATNGNVTIEELLNTTEIYVIPLFNPDGHSILNWYPLQRKNLRISDDDGDGTLIDETEVHYVWNAETNKSEIIYEDSSDSDQEVGEDAPGGVDLNRNYDFKWYGTGSSSDKLSEVYRGPYPASEPEVQALQKFIAEHDFRYALSLHSGIFAVIKPWGYDFYAIPPHNEELTDVMNKLCNITGFPDWESVGGYTVNGEWGDYNLAIRDILPFTIETYTDFQASNIWDAFNPPANEVINNSAIIYDAAVYLAMNPHINEMNQLPAVSRPQVSLNEQAGELTVSWTASDPDNDQLSFAIYYGHNHKWQTLETDITQSSHTFDLGSLRNGNYTFKVVCYDGIDRVISYSSPIVIDYDDIATISLNINDDQSKLYITVDDDDVNYDPFTIENVQVHVASSANPLGLNITLTEESIDSGIFSGTVFLTTNSSEATNNETLLVFSSDQITVFYIDNTTSSGTQTVSASIDINYETPTLTELNANDIRYALLLAVPITFAIYYKKRKSIRV